MGIQKSFLLLNSTASGSTYGSLQDGGSVTAATTATGWTVGTTAATAYANQDYSTKVLAFTSTAQPASGPSNTGECWRSQNAYTGNFEAGTWTVALSVISSTAAASGSGKLRVRIWKTSDQTGITSPIELTSSTITTTSWSNLSTSSAQSLTGTQSIGATAFAGEYLFVEVALELDTASANSSADVVLRIDGTNSKITTWYFDPSDGGDGFTDDVPGDGLKITDINHKGGDNTGSTGASVIKYYQMTGYYTAGATYESFVATGSPASSTTTNPNTGHALVNTFVSAFWQR